MTNLETMSIIKEMKINRLYKRVINEIMEDAKGYSGENLQERLLARLNDVSHGLSTGIVGSLIYYSDTCKFFRTYKKEIVELTEAQALDLGEDVLSMVADFNGLDKQFSISEVAKVLYGPYQDTDYHQMISNHLSWFAYENIAFDLMNRLES